MIINLNIWSPRWGHSDVYEISFDIDELKITMQARNSKAEYQEGRDPVWSGENILDIFRNDGIYAPWNFQDCIEWVWLKWRERELSDDQVEEELNYLATWLNTITRNKPSSEFWSYYF